MIQSSGALEILAACLLGVALFTLIHRRDAFGAILAGALGFAAVSTSLVGFAGVAPTRDGAAQLQAFAVVAEVVGVLTVAVGVSLAAVLRRRTGSDLLANPSTFLGGGAVGGAANRQPGGGSPTADETSSEVSESLSEAQAPSTDGGD